MAVSLALNWSPPPSSPLFDESATSGSASLGSEAATQGGSLASSPMADSSTAPTPSTSSTTLSAAEKNMASMQRQQQQASSPYGNRTGGLSVQAMPPPRSNSTSPQPRSYAAAASHPQQSFVLPSYPGAAMTSQVRKTSSRRGGLRLTVSSSISNHKGSTRIHGPPISMQ